MRRIPCALVVLVPSLLLAAPQDGLQKQSLEMFNAMLNVSQPSAHLGQRRGVVSGGSVVERSRIMSESLYRIVPPSFESGCGGIDLFGGSFSFISAQQFESLLRSIASNASGYAFEMALGAMCPTCVETMETLQRKVQQLNQGFLNSCQLAKGVVNNTADALNVAHADKTSLLGMAKGWGDVFESRSTTTGSSPVEQAESNMSREQRVEAGLQGNLVWKALKGHGVANWFADGDDTLLEAIMSITGSVIVGDPEDAGAGKNFSLTSLRGNLIAVQDLMHGSHPGDEAAQKHQKVLMYACDDHSEYGCMHPRITEVNLQGLVPQIRSMLLGDQAVNDSVESGRVGLLMKFRHGTSVFTQDEASFLELVPGTIGSGLRTLARTDIGVARVYAERAAPVIVMEMVQVILNDLLNAAEHALALDSNAYTAKVTEQIRFAREELGREYKSAVDRYGNPQSLLAYYQDLVDRAKGGRTYAATSLSE
jgi:conjugative transfer pilus assembly protein TraH